MRALELSELILFSIFSVCLSTEPIGTGGPSVVPEGGDALLTCVVMNPYANETVIWRKGPNEILSAGKNRVTGDKRISILHDESKKKKSTNGGEVYVLLIKNVRPDDSDVYGCEVNSDPMLRSFHPLTVKSKSIKSTDNNDTTPTASGSGNSSSSGGPSSSDMDDIIYASEDDNKDGMAPPVTHDFTQCCEALNVSAKCKGFCTVHNIIDGSTGVEPEACEADFPSIVKCMADGRNHVPCCERKKIPDICQDMCQGEYTPFNDYLKSRVSCVAHTLPGLQCILEGIQTLPSEPQAVSVLPLNERSIQISWAPPEKLANTIQNYRINVTRLQTFDEDRLAAENAVFSIRVPAGVNTTTVNDLEPNTMYSITVMSENEHGSSLPSTRIRTLTLENSSKGGPKMTPVNGTTPTIPDVRGCCMKNGVTHRTCLDKMCDPVRADFTEVPDLMVCAPWANITFACLANDIDHTPCCRSRGIPDQCLAFCSGQVHSINFNYFKCLQYMAEYSTCLLEGYGVLPGAPLQLKAKMVSSNFAVIDWKEPKVLSDTVQKYHLHYRRLGSGDEYVVVEKDRAPMILEYMDPTTYYEVFVVAVNMYGRGAPSMRLVFQTKRGYAVDSTPNYNMTNCCISSGVLPQCMILCTYDLKMSDFQASGPVCQQQVSNILRCGAGGRDHSECCSRRGVPATCLGRCRGVVSPATTDCMAFAGNIIQCLEEGTENIPGPVEDLHIVSVGNDSISLAWVPSEGQTNSSKPTDYLVQYGKVNNMTMYETVVKLEHEVNTTETEIELGDLDRTSLYRITVVARGVHGQSLPSSMLLVNISQTNKDSTIYGVPSPPHTLTVSGHSATTITVAWHPPEFSHPHEEISYQVFHKNKFNHSIISTRLQWARFAKLTPNTQNIIYIVAVGKMGTSLPSETLVAWTDPALPAFVEPPTIQPSDMIQEGGSMTVLCLALGNPAPTISLYVGGHLVRQDTSRHMVTTIHNITSDMKDVSCYADNGYGVPMQSSKKIRISYPPRLQASGIQVASVGDSVELKCTVKANPEPKMLFWRDHDGRIPVIQGANFDMMISDSDNDPELFTMSLKINKMELQDAGDYFCHATNALGDATRAVSVRIRNSNPVKNITECCIEQNVSSPCLTACSFYIDVQTVIDNPRCLPDFDKLMKCAADGSDHRGCCVQKNVPRKCLNWCRGEPVINGGICTLQYTKTIIGCFQENRERLPGPPIGVEVQVLANNQVKVSWDPPNKNPHTVEGYRVFWYDAEESRDGNISNIINSGGPGRMDTKDLSIILDGLQQHVLYELVVKAGNHYGASVLSDPLRFTLDDHLVTSARHGTHSGVIGGIIAGIIAIILAIVGFMLAKKRKLGHKTVGSNGVAFENPSYLREIHMDRVQITPVSAPVSSAPSAITTNNHSTSSNDYRHEELHAPAAHIAAETEVNPSLIEEFKLGSSNAGFKKLVS